jgi:hypothetical protein
VRKVRAGNVRSLISSERVTAFRLHVLEPLGLLVLPPIGLFGAAGVSTVAVRDQLGAFEGR